MDKFSYEANGYNRDEVNQFVNDVIKETEDIVKRVESQRDEIIYLKKELAHYKELEDTLETYNQKVEKILIGKQNKRGELIEVWLKLYV